MTRTDLPHATADLDQRKKKLSDSQSKALKHRLSQALRRRENDGDRIARRTSDAPLPLAFAQQRLWFLAQVEQGARYNVPFAADIHGELDVSALRRALARLVERHEALRTVFPAIEGMPVQRVQSMAEVAFELKETDVSASADPRAQAAAIAADETERPFDLAQGPLVRARLVRQDAQLHTLLLTMHHIVTDGWSMGILERELGALYGAARRGDVAHALPALAVQYADYATWQHQRIGGEALREEENFWSQTLADAPALLSLPLDRPRAAQPDHAGAGVEIVFDAALTDGLKSLGARHGATLFMTLMAAWANLLGRLANQDDVVVGMAVANRSRVETEPLIGLFANTLALRLDTSGAPDAAAMIARVKDRALQAQQHQELPFERVVEITRPDRSLAYGPLFQAMFAWQNHVRNPLALEGLQIVTQAEPAQRAAKFDLTLALREQDDGIVGRLDYATALFDRATVDDIAAQLRTLLAAMVADDRAPLRSIELLSTQARADAVARGTGQAPATPARTLASLFESTVARRPSAPALSRGQVVLSYAELDARANRIAHHLLAQGFVADDIVAVALPRSIELVVAILAITKAGAAWLPIDPDYPVDRIAFMLQDARPARIFTHAALAARLPALTAWLDFDAFEAEAVGASAAAPADAHRRTPARVSDAAYVIYTSGSTGLPKGVVVTHRGLEALAATQVERFALTGDSRVLQFSSPSFDAMVMELLMAFAPGACLCIPGAGALVGATLARTLRAECITHSLIPPAALSTLEVMPAPILQTLIVGGDAVSEAVLARWAPGRRMVNAYGPTEATACATMAAPMAAGKSTLIGAPVAGARVYVLDEHLHLVPRGVTGEIWIGGEGVARGYLNRPELDAQRFLDDPFAAVDGARMYRTGDLGRWQPDGMLEFIGRNDSQVKIRGFRIELGEIEAQLARQPGVRDVVVIGREDEPGDKRLVAYVVAPASARPEVQALRAALLATLPEFMVPSAFVILDALPRTANDKIDRKALPVPDASAYPSACYEAPRGETEATVARIWSDLLKVGQVGRHDNFFQLGGHSLLAVRAVSAVCKALSRDVDVRDLFLHPELAAFAAVLETAATPSDAIVPVPRTGQAPTSFEQQRLWIMAQLDGGSQAYNVALEADLHGKLHPDALRLALVRVVERHESLRTRFALVQGMPMQQVVDVAALELPIPLDDLRTEAQPHEAARAIAMCEAATPFDLPSGLPIRARILRLADRSHRLLVTMHHLVCDGWSLEILLREVGILYGVYKRDEADPLPSLPVQYADFAHWQRAEARGPMLAAQRDYWVRQLANAPVLHEVPTDRPRPAQQDYEGAAIPVELDAACTTQLRELSRRHGMTLFMTVLAGWALVLARLSNQNDIVIGTPMANRSRPEVEGLIGFFVNSLSLRVALDGELTVAGLLEQVRQCVLEAQQNQDLPFDQLVEQLRPQRSLAYNPLFQLMLAWHAGDDIGLALDGVEASVRTAASRIVAKFDLTLALHDRGDRVVGQIEYAPALFDAATVERHAHYLRQALAAMAADESCRIADVQILPPAERQKLLVDWNATQRPPCEVAGVHALFERQARRTPQAVAAEFNGSALTYAQLNAQANRLAHHLVDHGVKPDDRVALCTDRGLETLVAILGVLKAGAAYVPLDPAYPAQHLAFVLEDADPILLLADAGGARSISAGPMPACPVWRLDDPVPAWAGRPSTDPDPTALGLESGHLAYIIYTSGSTGRPKGVMVPHRGVTNLVSMLCEDWAEHRVERMLQFASICFDASAKEMLFGLSTGATLVLRDDSWMVDGQRFWARCAAERLNYVNLPTRFWQSVTHGELEIPSCVRLVVFGGEAVESDALARWAARHGHRPALVNAYGPTETTINASINRFERFDNCLTIGRPVANTRIHILDAQGRLVPVGVVGELHVAGAGVTRGYFRRPELTAERFVDNPFATGERMYRTGDLGRWLPDGTIEFLGRNDHQVKIRGLRIELGEIEARLAQQPGVRAAVVMAREDLPGDKRLVAYVVAEPQEPQGRIDTQALRAALGALLPDYMVPAAFVMLEALPLTPNGKTDRNALPAPQADAFAGTTYEAPQGAIEQALAEIWGVLLGLERVGRQDHFFRMGGHSLLAVRAVTAIRERFGADVAVRDVFTQPVLAELARFVSQAGRSQATTIACIDHARALPLSFAQQRLWLLSQMEGASQAYHMPFAVELRGALDVAALGRAFDRIVERHEALRTTFAMEDGQPMQRVGEAVNVELRCEDIRTMADPAAHASVVAAREARAPFDLARGPLIRASLLRCGGDAWTLLVTMHHIVCDGWSMGILLRELGAFYEAETRGEPVALAPLSIQYADFAAWQHDTLAGEGLQRQGEFWREALAGAPTLLALPLDRPRLAQRDDAGASLGVELDAPLSAALKALGERHGTTLFMTLMAGWAVLLARLSRQDDLVIGTPVANREQAQTQALIGFFVNTLALRVKADGALTVAELLAQVKHSALAAQQHQDIPFEQVVELVQPERSLAWSPLVQVMFGWQNNERSELALPGVQVSLQQRHGPRTAKFDLTLALHEDGERIAGAIEYASALFDRSTIERMVTALRSVLTAMVADDGARLDAIDVLAPSEREQLLVTWNDTARAVPEGTLGELFEAQAARSPEAIAVVHGARALSYAELDARANRLAHHLRRLGVVNESRVALCVERGLDAIVGMLAIVKAGAAYVPLDPVYPAERLRFMLDDSGCVALLTQDALTPMFDDLAALPTLRLDSQSHEWHDAPATPPACGATRDALAYIIYTSGSTGIPKGVMVEHGSVADLVLATDYVQLESTDAIAQASSTSFDAATFEIWGALLNGARLVCIDRDALLSPSALGAEIDRSGVNVMFITTALFNQLAREIAPVLGGLKYLLFGGEQVDAGWVEHVLAQGRPQHLLHVYGPTETTTFATWHEVTEVRPGCTVPIGKPLANMRAYVLDARRQPVPVGVAGEIYIGGRGVARGYLNRLQLTAERFIDNPFIAGERLYKTGDVGRWLPDGAIEFIGRNDHQVKIRGLRIELGEIESRLAALEGVRDAIVLARQDGEGDKRLVAYVVGDVDVPTLRTSLGAALPDYMVPAAFVVLDALPLNPNGKVDRKALPAPQDDAFAGAVYEAPQGPVEEVVAEIWKCLLGREQIGRSDHFFRIGGHSLLAVRAVTALQHHFDVDIAIGDVFRHAVLSELADHIVNLQLEQFDPSELLQIAEEVQRDSPQSAQ
jgi:amino acid adenylation domain-containing protein